MYRLCIDIVNTLLLCDIYLIRHEEIIRLIFARHASKEERRLYEQG